LTQPVITAPTKPVVLIANAHEWAARSFETVFPAERFEVRRVATGPLAVAAARELRPLAVILDYDIPELECNAVCRALVGDPGFALSTPIVITSEMNPGRPQQLAALRAGAWDFCVQPLNGDVFYRKIMAFIGASWMVQQARSDAAIDDPTGLYTQGGFRQRAIEFAAQLARDGQTATLLLITMTLVAEPEAVPDGAPETAPGERNAPTMDHRMLIVADCVRRVCRASDVLARLSATEIGVMMRETSEAGVQSLLRRVQECLTPQRTSDAILADVSIMARSAKLPLRGNVPGDLDALIEEVRRTEGIPL
jgi:PleD family two-component response regulator